MLDSESYRLETRTDIAGRSLICRYAGIRAIDLQYRYNSTVGFLPVQIGTVVDPGSTGTTVVAIDLQYRCNSTVGFIPVQINSRSW